MYDIFFFNFLVWGIRQKEHYFYFEKKVGVKYYGKLEISSWYNSVYKYHASML